MLIGGVPIYQAGDAVTDRFKQDLDVVGKAIVGLAVGLAQLVPGLQTRQVFVEGAVFTVLGHVILVDGARQQVALGGVQQLGGAGVVEQGKGKQVTVGGAGVVLALAQQA